jgi:hypothetical protein
VPSEASSEMSSEVLHLTRLTCGRRRHPETSWNHRRRSCGVSARSTRSSRRICSGWYENWESTNLMRGAIRQLISMMTDLLRRVREWGVDEPHACKRRLELKL